MKSRTPQLVAIAVILAGVSACAEGPVAVPHVSSASTTEPPRETVPPEWDQAMVICKVGSSATFDVAVEGMATTQHALADGACKNVWTWVGVQDQEYDVMVTELAAAGITLDSVIVKNTRFGEVQSTYKLTGTYAVPLLSANQKGAIVTFYNRGTPPPPPPPPPPGGEGCTPGYWKQSQHFDSWVGYTPNTLFSAVFDNAFPGQTLLQVVSNGGGGLNALGRHTVAALLNTASGSVNYGMSTPAQVIAAFNAAYPGSDYETLKNRFEGWNEDGCPIN